MPGHKIASSSPDVGTNVSLLDKDFQNISVDGAITAKDGIVVITKGTALAGTLAAPVAGLPTAGGDDGKELRITSSTAAAHVITSAVRGFNAKGSSGTATLTAAKGNGLHLIAFNGDWYNVASTGCTYA